MDKRDKEFSARIIEVKKHHINYGARKIALALNVGKKRITRVANKEKEKIQKV